MLMRVSGCFLGGGDDEMACSSKGVEQGGLAAGDSVSGCLILCPRLGSLKPLQNLQPMERRRLADILINQ